MEKKLFSLKKQLLFISISFVVSWNTAFNYDSNVNQITEAIKYIFAYL